MKITINLFIFLVFISTGFSQNDSLDIEIIRTKSGVDRTRVNIKVPYSISYFDRNANRSLINNRINSTAGINKWGLGLKYEITTLDNGISGAGFNTKSGYLRFSVLNAFHVKGRNAIAGGSEFTIPTAPQSFGSNYCSINLFITYAYTIGPSLFLAFQPQYTSHIAKDIAFPDLSALTIRTFMAKFIKTGWFYIFESRIIHDLLIQTSIT